ncbi:MAG: alcohol dehydrogenase catalytic domain-containing protein [Lautropia sp.]
MRATVIDAYGPAEVLRVREVPTPEPGADEVLVRLRWAGVNHLEIDVRNGVAGMPVTLPHIPGTEGVGEIAAVGTDVRRWTPGQRVGTCAFRTCGRCRSCRLGHANLCADIRTLGVQLPGSYAQYVVVREDQLVAIPDGLCSRAAIASYKLATAWEALVETLALQAGETLLVTGAGGGVGVSAVLLARELGATVIAASGSRDKHARLLALGATHVVDYRGEDLRARIRALTDGVGVDAVLDVAAGPVLRDAIAGCRPGGRVAVVGAHAGEETPIDMLDLFRRHIAIHGCGRYTARILEAVFARLAGGMSPVPVQQVFDLADAASAHRLIESRNFVGRLLLDCA